MNSLVKSVKAKEQILLNNCHHLHGGLFRFFIREKVVILRKKTVNILNLLCFQILHNIFVINTVYYSSERSA